MCGRYYRRGQKQEIATRMKAARLEPGMPELLASYNIAPTTHQPVVRHTRDGAEREMLLMRWGMVPFFANSLADFKGFSTFNAKAESLAKSATWREPWARGRRCLVPADGFYEWKDVAVEGKKAAKQPYAFRVTDEPMFAFAGLWDAWHDRQTGSWLQSFTIITTQPNELTGQVHNRMPVILHERDYDEWLLRDGPAPAHLLQPFAADQMAMARVNEAVGNVRNDHPDLLNSK